MSSEQAELVIELLAGLQTLGRLCVVALGVQIGLETMRIMRAGGQHTNIWGP